MGLSIRTVPPRFKFRKSEAYQDWLTNKKHKLNLVQIQHYFRI